MAILTPDQEAALLDFSPMSKVKGEPIGIFDISPSMGQANDKAGTITRIGLLAEAFPILVNALAGLDQAGEHEEGGGGLMTWVFNDKVTQIGDVNKGNVTEAARKLIPSGRGTYAGEALDAALDAAIDEEDLDPTTPIVIVLGTDGEAHDQDRVLDFFKSKVRGRVRVAVGVFGSGDDHNATVKSYLDIADSDAAHKTHLRVVSFSQMTTGQQLADAALGLFGVTG